MRKIILFRRPSGKPSDIGEKELIALTAFMISLVALSIDMMLPALPQIGADLGIVDNNSRQAILVVFFAGLTAAQILYGPLADRFGRKPAVALGTSIFLVGSLVSVVANDFEALFTINVGSISYTPKHRFLSDIWNHRHATDTVSRISNIA